MKHLNLTRNSLTRGFSALLLIASGAGLSAGAAHAIGFVPPPGQGAPSQATGGASRGNVQFAPRAGQGAPRQATGGASRGNVQFAPRAGQGAPRQATGGASRGNFFQPPTGQGAPRQATGGASRGNLFKPAKGRGTPLRAAGGASRVGRYEIDSSNLTANAGPGSMIAMLPPSYNGTTISARPTFMTYLPASTAKVGVFSLKDEAGNTVYEQNLALTGEAGLLSIKLPSDAPELAVNQNYQWYIALKVDGELNPSTPYVDGWIQRIESSAAISAAMQQPDLLKQAEVLGANGVWYDCVEKLATLRANQPNNAAIEKQWTQFLQSVSLQEVHEATLLSAVSQ